MTQSERLGRIVIVGASIGGLATALALGQAGFTDVAVYERDPDPDDDDPRSSG